MPYRKLMKILQGYKAVKAEENLDQLRIVANPRLLESKLTNKEYPKLFKAFEKTKNKFGIKTVTVSVGLTGLMKLKDMFKGGGKNGKQ